MNCKAYDCVIFKFQPIYLKISVFKIFTRHLKQLQSLTHLLYISYNKKKEIICYEFHYLQLC